MEKKETEINKTMKLMSKKETKKKKEQMLTAL